MLAVLVASLATCGSPTAPGSGVAASPALEISGPRTVAPGTSAPFIALARDRNGKVTDVTSSATWVSTNPGVLSVSANGLVTSQITGETYLSAAFESLQATTEVIAVPSGTFRLLGRVVEAGLIDFPVQFARLVVTGGPSAGLVDHADADGRYRLYGVSSEAEVTIERAEYRQLVEHIVVTDHQSIDFVMTFTGQRENLAGPYTLTITASRSCRDALPAAVRSRSYGALLVMPSSRSIVVTLRGATFDVNAFGDGNRFSGSIDAGGEVSFSLYPNDFGYPYGSYFPDLVEFIDQNRFVVGGDVRAGASADGTLISGTLRGDISVWSTLSIRTALCQADDHEFVLSRPQ
jgi:hypothetical protein